MIPGKKGVEAGKERPGIETIQEIGHDWEKEQFLQLIEAIEDDEKIAYSYVPVKGEEKDHFEEVDLIKQLTSKKVPELIIEASFEFENIFENIDYDVFDFEGARPDIIWITDNDGVKVLNIIDIKTAAEPSLKHFSEVVLYALSLDALIKKKKLDDIYQVNLEYGYIWPGTHDVDLFIKTYNAHKARASVNPLKDALDEILVEIKLELYYEHVKSFFEERVPSVYHLDFEQAHWFFSKSCNLCDFREECSKECNEKNLIFQVPEITKGQVESLINADIITLEQMISDESGWKRAISSNITLKPVQQILQTKARAILESQVLPIPGKKTYLMPGWSDISLFIEVHFDPITGLSYGIGARRSIWNREEHRFDELPEILINDKAGTSERIFENSSEKAIFIDFLKFINRAIQTAIDNKKSIHFYFWDSLELKQLKRMMNRYFQDDAVMSELEKLIQMYAPEGKLENPDIFASIPGTIVKNTLNYILALPLKFDYSLIHSANAIQTAQGKNYFYAIKKHFYTEMSDQIPFERAYDLWTNEVRIFDYETKEKYTREKVRDKLKETIDRRLKALETIVRYMQQQQGEQLLLQKKPLAKIKPTQKRGMDPTTNELFIFERLNEITKDLENKQQRLLPVDEKEARFLAMRGLHMLDRNDYLPEIEQIISTPKYAKSKPEDFYVFSIPDTSLDAKINEGAFLLVLTTEVDPDDHSKPQVVTDLSVSAHMGLPADEIESLSDSFGLKNSKYIPWIPLKSFLQVTLVKIVVDREESHIILKTTSDFYGKTIDFAFENGLLDPSLPFVIDPVHKDFNIKDYESILKLIGKNPIAKPKKKKRR